MTYEEAIKIINEGVKTGNCPTNLCHYSETGCGDCKWRIALYKAIEALEKQIPKKPSWEYLGDSLSNKDLISKCPLCDNGVEEGEHHCECGQVLDWSE